VPTGYYGNPALSLPSTTNFLHNLVIKYATTALNITGTGGYNASVSDIQIVSAGTGISLSGSIVPVYNVLVYNVTNAFTLSSATLTLVQGTVDQCTNFIGSGHASF